MTHRPGCFTGLDNIPTLLGIFTAAPRNDISRARSLRGRELLSAFGRRRRPHHAVHGGDDSLNVSRSVRVRGSDNPGPNLKRTVGLLHFPLMCVLLKFQINIRCVDTFNDMTHNIRKIWLESW